MKEPIIGHFSIIPRTISGKNDPSEDQRMCTQKGASQKWIREKLRRIGLKVAVHERLVCISVEGQGSLNWNRNLPMIIGKLGIEFFPMIFPKRVTDKAIIEQSFIRLKTTDKASGEEVEIHLYPKKG